MSLYLCVYGIFVGAHVTCAGVRWQLVGESVLSTTCVPETELRVHRLVARASTSWAISPAPILFSFPFCHKDDTHRYRYTYRFYIDVHVLGVFAGRHIEEKLWSQDWIPIPLLDGSDGSLDQSPAAVWKVGLVQVFCYGNSTSINSGRTAALNQWTLAEQWGQS